MRSSNPLITTLKPSVPVRLASHWIEYLAIPICAAIMETQPIALFMLVLGTRLFGDDALFPDALSITLLMLSLHWWLMWLRYHAEQQESWQKQQKKQDFQLPKLDTGLCFLGIFLVAVMYSLLHIEELANSQFVTVSLLIVGWSCWRAIYQSQENLNDQLLSLTFRICFFIMLCILLLALFKSFAGDDTFINATASAFPIFFVTGVIGLSFTRLGTIQREREKQQGIAGKESIRKWITGLTATWIAVVLISILLESLPLQLISSLFNVFWSIFGIIGSVILFVFALISDTMIYVILLIIVFVYRLLPHHNTIATPNPPVQANSSSQIGSTFVGNQIAFFLLLVAVVIGIILLLRRLRNKTRVIVSDEEEEVREQLNRTSILKERDKERKNQQRIDDLETLDPDSMRVSYRNFLQSVAQKRDDIRRKAHETPLEYQRRLLELVQKQHGLADDAHATTIFLSELTDAYSQERYGNKSIDQQHKEALRVYLPQFLEQMTPKETKPKSSAGWSAEKARWGED